MKKFIKRLFKWLLYAAIAAHIYAIICIWVMPPITLTQISNMSYGLQRNYISWKDLGYNIKLAAIASEDQSFTEHSGFDWNSIEKSLRAKNNKSKVPLGGGASTISQQVAKNVFLWQGNGVSKYIRKVPEFYFTFLIETLWSKQRILEVYLNTIEMGKGIFGAEAAAQAYFHKPAKQLTKAEAAKIVACFPNPKLFSVIPMSKRVAVHFPDILHEMHNIADDEGIVHLLQSK